MKLEGIHTLKAERRVIWVMIMDPDLLVKITPGISELVKKDEFSYEAISEVKIGPVKGRFKGELSLTELNEPESFNLKISQNSKIGNVDAKIHIQLNDLGNEQTEIIFDGDAQMSGVIARTGQRVVSGVANSLTKQFFDALDKEIEFMKGVDG